MVIGVCEQSVCHVQHALNMCKTEIIQCANVHSVSVKLGATVCAINEIVPKRSVGAMQ